MPKRRASCGDAAVNAGESSETRAQNSISPVSRPKQHANVEAINSMSVEAFHSRYVDDQWLRYAPEPETADTSFNISLTSAGALSTAEYEPCFHLIEITSRSDYEASSWGWHPRRKRKEMLEKEMKYLLVRRQGTEDGIEGFLSFMVTRDSAPSVPVVYIYEVHLNQTMRKLGLGSHLMQVVENIAEKLGVGKVMLTCFLSNAKAHKFYQHQQYETDECSPADRKTRKKLVKVDYVIMSKRVGIVSRHYELSAEPSAMANLLGPHAAA